MTCHSAQYVSTQPQSLGRAYWDATVKKMKTAFGAPLRDEDIQ
jgi:sulfite dehydrogenase